MATTLFDVRNAQFCQAVETAAGGKVKYDKISFLEALHVKSDKILFLVLFQLDNMVIENEVVGKSLLKNSQLKKRTTFMPLNKLTATDLHHSVIQKATKV